MASSLIKLCALLVFVAALHPAVAATAAGADGNAMCLAPRDAQALVAGHKIKTWPAIKAMAGISDQYKEVSAVRVCQQDGATYYVVNVASPSGESKRLVLNAVDGSN